MSNLQKVILIVAKEDTFSLTKKVYDEIKKDKKGFKPFILLISPLEEIIYKKKITTIFKSSEIIYCWEGMKKILIKGNTKNLLKEKYPQLYRKVAKQICSHPTQLYDLNFRIQYKKFNGDDLLEVMSALTLHLLNVLSSYKKVTILDFSIYDISRTILLDVCKEKKIIYKTLVHSRFENYWLLSKNLGQDVAKSLSKKTLLKDDIKIAKEKINKYCSQKVILPFQERSSIIQKYSIKKSIRIIACMFFRIMIYLKRFFFEFKEIRLNKNLQRLTKQLTGDTLITLKNSLICNFRFLKRIWQPTEIKYKKPEKYIYFPLPNTVENSELRFNGGILSEKIIIDLIRKDLYEYKLLIKDHRSMIMDRKTSEIKRFRNIYHLNYISEWLNSKNITNPKNLINSSALTIVISGTAGLEAAILNKPVLILGTPVYAEYFILKGNDKKNLKDLEIKLNNNKINFEDFKVNKNITHSYIAAIIKYGFRCDLYDLIKNPNAFNKKNTIKNLVDFMI